MMMIWCKGRGLDFELRAWSKGGRRGHRPDEKKAGGFVFEFWEIRCGGTSAASPRRGVARGGFLNAWNVFESPSVARNFLLY